MSTRVILVVLVGLVAVTGAPRMAWPQKAPGFERLWYQAYDEGVRAAQRGDWATAIAALEAATRGGPAPGRRVLFQGDRVDVFNPDYYLGLAYNATKRFNEADAAFARVSSAVLIGPGDRLFDQLRKQTALARYERVLTDGERALLAGRFTDVEKLIAGVIGSLADDGRAGDLAKRAKDGAAKVAEANVPAPNAPLPADQRTAANVPTSPNPPLPTSPPPADTAGSIPVDRPAVQQYSPERDKNAGLRNPVTSGVPESRPAAPINVEEITLRGATAYFLGNYEEAARVLQPALLVGRPSSVVALYLACSRAALVASGRADAATLVDAREMFAAARGGDIDRHLRFISPRVREMLGDLPAAAR